MTKGEQLYKAFEAAREKNPEVKIIELAERMHIHPSMYYAYRRQIQQQQLPVKAERRKATPPVYERITEQQPSQAPMMMVLGSPEQIRAFAAGLYK